MVEVFAMAVSALTQPESLGDFRYGQIAKRLLVGGVDIGPA